jgi:hypothetical protein
MFGWLWRKRPDPQTTFSAQRESLRAAYFDAVASSGKPRGLRWQAIEWAEEVTFARDRPSGQLIALVCITVHFEAIEGGEMEGIEAVGLPRLATAVFIHNKNKWNPTNNIIFNLTPLEVMERSQGHYQRI